MATKREHEVRIIGGQFKGKKLPVLDLDGLRPTTDRVRETVFSWISDKIVDAQVLDLFAGSGALGFESFSRGAQDVTLVELNKQNYANLAEIAKGFNSKNLHVINDDAIHYVSTVNKCFDVVFLDPPYKANLLKDVIPKLLSNNLINNDSIIYVEMNAGTNETIPGFEVIREETAGQAKFSIWKKSSFLF